MTHLARQVAQTRQLQIAYLYLQRERHFGTTEILLAAPVVTPDEAGGRLVGVAFLFVVPSAQLFPAIEQWPGVSPSAETLVVAAQGDSLIFLSMPRNPQASAPPRSMPLSSSIPAAAAVRGVEGFVEGIDYRGVPVLAALAPIDSTPWHLVAKIDTAEVYAPLRRLAVAISIVVVALILGGGFLFVAAWSRQEARLIVQRFQTEIERQKLARRFELLSKHANDIILLADGSGRIVEVNDRALSAYGYDRTEIVTRQLQDLQAPGATTNEGMATLATGREGSLFETEQRRKDGSVFPVEISARRIEIEGETWHQLIVRDITERKRAEAALGESRQIMEGILNTIPVRVFWKDKNLVYLGCNAPFAHDAGFADPKDVVGKDDYQMGWRDQAESYRADDRLVIESGRSKILIDEPQTTPEGKTIALLTSKIPLRDPAGQIVGVLGTYMDITEYKRAQDALRLSEAKYRGLFEVTRDAIMMIEPPSWKFTSGNRAAVRMFGASSEEEFVTYGPWQLSPERQPDGRTSAEKAAAMIETAMREGSHLFEWTHRRIDGVEFPADVLLNRIVQEGKVMLHATVRDITERKQAEQTREQLAAALEETVQAIASTVEMRDPYTAGHQRRVTKIAEATAMEMGLPADRIRGLKLACTVHDLGKIRTPADILSKPGKLSDLELELVKTHSQAGYDILKPISFPWPIADIVLQHHERVDGSGYPNGLKGDAILPEARILAVADVVEAIMSHRPYRPALGLAAAIAEIRQGSGKLYDPAVVDACVKVMADGRFDLSGA
jgi:PAS domain S-box-containing protein